FFFQAEDGIRDFHVTGVQTCALPISCPSCRSRRSRAGSCGSRARERASLQPYPWSSPSAGLLGRLDGLGCRGSVILRRLLLGLRLGLGRELDTHRCRPDAELALADDRVDARDVALHGAQAAVALELSGRRLEAQVEQLFLGLLEFVDETLVLESVELVG